MLIYFAEEQERGKAQPLDSLIFTKNGYKRMGDIQKGDIIIDGLGKETVVEDIFPQGKKPIYKITFSDRTSVKCSDEHYGNAADGLGGERTQTVRARLLL